MLTRVLTAVVGIPIVLGASLSTHPLPFFILLIAAATVSLVELFRLLNALDLTDSRSPTISFLRGLSLIAWVLLPLVCLAKLHESNDFSSSFDIRAPLLLIFLPLWAGDSAAIFAGRAFGKHLLAPNVSPKKTWEGAIANLIACILTAAGTAVWIGLPTEWGLLIGVSTGVLGQAGDLFQSWLKRKAGVKDSGTILPGHGGILDRLDSLFTSAIPAAAIYMIASGR